MFKEMDVYKYKLLLQLIFGLFKSENKQTKNNKLY